MKDFVFHSTSRIGVSGKHKISAVNESLSLYCEGLSWIPDKLSLEDNKNLSTKSHEIRDSGETEDKFSVLTDEEKRTLNETSLQRTSILICKSDITTRSWWILMIC